MTATEAKALMTKKPEPITSIPGHVDARIALAAKDNEGAVWIDAWELKDYHDIKTETQFNELASVLKANEYRVELIYNFTSLPKTLDHINIYWA